MLSRSELVSLLIADTESDSAGKSVRWRMRRSRNSRVLCWFASPSAAAPPPSPPLFKYASNAWRISAAVRKRLAGSSAQARRMMSPNRSSMPASFGSVTGSLTMRRISDSAPPPRNTRSPVSISSSTRPAANTSVASLISPRVMYSGAR